jgi:hypothetical protein
VVAQGLESGNVGRKALRAEGRDFLFEVIKVSKIEDGYTYL